MKVVLGFTNEKLTNKIKSLLYTNGIIVDYSCTSIKQLHELSNMHEKIIIISQLKFKDGNILDITFRDANNYVICISNNIDESFRNKLNSFIIRSPIDVKLFINTTKMIININRNSSDKTMDIDHGKSILMDLLYLSEESAHRFIQKNSMNLGLRKEIVSFSIVQAFSGTA